MAADDTWEMPESEDRCPTCGKFVSFDDGFYDVEPGGCRGIGLLEVYCNEICAERSYEWGHEDRFAKDLDCSCEV